MYAHALNVIKRPEKLVLPKPVLDYISASMKRDSRAILGSNEIQIYDVGERGHSVCVWNFTNGRISVPSGGLELFLRLLQDVIQRIRTGVAIVDPSSPDLRLTIYEAFFHSSGRVEYARIGPENEPLVTKVGTIFGVPGWKPHGVMGGRTIRLNRQDYELGKVLCLASSRHLTHPEILLRHEPATTLTFFINYFIPSIPSIDVLEMAIRHEQMFGIEKGFSAVYLVGSLNDSGEIVVSAWQLGVIIDLQAVANLRAHMLRETARRFDDLTFLNHVPPEMIEFKAVLWKRLFEEEVKNKLMVQIPVEDENGDQITIV